MKKKNSNNDDPALTELQAIKRLLILSLLKSGLTQGQIGKALGVDQSNISRLVPVNLRSAKGNAK